MNKFKHRTKDLQPQQHTDLEHVKTPLNQAQVLYQYRAIQEKLNMQTNYAHKFNDYQLKVQGNNFVADH
jgi:hypothetical protein